MSEIIEGENKTTRLSLPSGNIVSLILVGALVAGAFVVGNLWAKVQELEQSSPTKDGKAAANAPEAPANQPTNPADLEVDIKNVDTKGEPFIGEPNAPVTLAYWMDFQCPFCKRFETTTLPELIDLYVKTGKLKVVFKDYQFLGPDSQAAGLAAKAVWELSPENYLKWNQAMFEAQDAENAGFGREEDIIELIRTKVPEVSADKVAELIESNRGKYQKEQDADRVEGSGFGIKGTPGFVIGTQRISGAQPTSLFTQTIEAELSR